VNILLTGAAGQLGSELIPLLSAYGRVTATDRFKPAIPVDEWVELDIGKAGELDGLLDRLQPGLIVNAAAYTAVDQAESDPKTAFEVNAKLPEDLARWAKQNDASLIHYSTDYIFDGSSAEPYREDDITGPKNVYGESKLAGERAITDSGCKHVILRTSWVYSSHGKNFVLSMLALARKGLSLKVVDDQRGCPTSARNLAIASCDVIENWRRNASGGGNGVFHYCDDQTLSWYDFAHAIFRLAVNAGLLEKEPELTPVPGTEFPTPAERPAWSVLDTQKIEDIFKIQAASFDQALQDVINEILTREH
jgi:dTDP-4-dehydrorhamnose reductase